MLVGYSFKLAMTVAIYLHMYAENKRRDRTGTATLSPGGMSSLPAVGEKGISKEEREAIESGMRDVTELDNPGFRYTL